jgi:RHS repeat-associated protein
MKWISKLAATAIYAVATFAVQAQTVVEYIHTDALGSPVAVTDANQNVIETTEYEPYGIQVNRQIADGPGYTGHVSDATTGLSYMQQRYYDSGIGRFLSVDPVMADDNTGRNFNRYWYAANNPYRFIDPDGRIDRESYKEIHQDRVAELQQQSRQDMQGIGEAIVMAMAAFPAIADAIAPDTNGSGMAPGEGALFSRLLFRQGAAAGAGTARRVTTSEATVAATPKIIQTNPKNLIPTQTKAEMSGSQVKRLASDMRRNGYDQSKPVDAARNESGRLEIQDGHHRTEAAKQAGIDKIPVRVWEDPKK